jgi:hypothetical protein
MAKCVSCSSQNTRVVSGGSRRAFIVICQNPACGATGEMILSLSSAVSDVLRARRAPTKQKTRPNEFEWIDEG